MKIILQWWLQTAQCTVKQLCARSLRRTTALSKIQSQVCGNSNVQLDVITSSYGEGALLAAGDSCQLDEMKRAYFS